MKKYLIRLNVGMLALCLLLGSTGCKQNNPSSADESSSQSETSRPQTETEAPGGVYSAEYWMEKLEPSSASTADYKAFNEALAQTDSTKCVDLAAMGDTISGDELRALLEEEKIPEDERYLGASKVTSDYYTKLLNNRGSHTVKDQNEVGYGFIVENTLLRTFPTADPSYEMANDEEFDLFNETRLNVFEPVRVLHQSTDGKWLFVQAWNYRGWAAADTVALTDRAEWEQYADPERVLVVTGNRVTLNENVYNETASGRELFMGTVLPMLSDVPETIDFMTTESGYAVLLPARGSDGKLVTVQALVPWNADVREGYLPYSEENVLRQVFKLAGDRHGWSDMNKSRDSTSVVTDVYRTFGFRLPRNSSQQAAMPAQTVETENMSDSEKAAAICEQPVGSLILMDGHVALYVGEENGVPYVLHSIYVAYDDEGTEEIYNAVVVTDLSLRDRDGETYLSGVNAIKVIG